MFWPLNGRSSIDCGSLKSLPHTKLGHTFGSFFGTPQNLGQHDVETCVLLVNLKAELQIGRPARCLPRPCRRTCCRRPSWISQPLPVHLPLGNPAFFMYWAASCGLPSGLCEEVKVRPRCPAGLIEPGNRRRDEVRCNVAARGPPAAVSRAWRSGPATTALRTLMSSNGGLLVLRVAALMAYAGDTASWDAYLVAASLSASVTG